MSGTNTFLLYLRNVQTIYFENFKDKRLLDRGNSILSRLFAHIIHSIKQLTKSQSESKAIYRFLQNFNVSQVTVIENMSSKS
ncbi:transposase DNA-binding-containing protein [Flavobacterium lipolyticum]|uniref:transposase DNA-binding-containing protein n=1 Tax=Flavobacterium lipolyticum TaxID=2893754 RepID=UPI003D177250